MNVGGAGLPNVSRLSVVESGRHDWVPFAET